MNEGELHASRRGCIPAQTRHPLRFLAPQFGCGHGHGRGQDQSHIGRISELRQQLVERDLIFATGAICRKRYVRPLSFGFGTSRGRLVGVWAASTPQPGRQIDVDDERAWSLIGELPNQCTQFAPI